MTWWRCCGQGRPASWLAPWHPTASRTPSRSPGSSPPRAPKSRPQQLTFHRAFDAALAAGANPADALGRLEDAGVDRVLTSGGGTDCTQGIGMLARLVELGRDHAPGVQIMAGGGVTADIVPRLVTAGVHAVHSSARRRPACPPATGAGVPSEAMDPELAAGIAVALRTADKVTEHGE